MLHCDYLFRQLQGNSYVGMYVCICVYVFMLKVADATYTLNRNSLIVTTMLGLV